MHGVIGELAIFLDPCRTGIKNWKDLARFFGFSHEEISRLENGGDAHILFFIKLRSEKPELTLSNIKEHLERLDNPRRDIFYKHEERMPGLKQILHKGLGQLSDDEFDYVLKNVANKLVTSRITGCWKDLAGKIDDKLYDRTQIKHIESCGRERQADYSPTEALMDVLSTREETVSRLLEGLQHIERNDVLKYLLTVIKEGKCWSMAEQGEEPSY